MPAPIEDNEGRIDATPRLPTWARKQSQLYAIDFERLVRDRNVPNGAFRVFHFLKLHADADGCCWPGRRRMKRDLGGDFVSLQNWIAKLQQAGWVKVEKYNLAKHPFVRQRDPSKRDGVVYWLLNGDLKNPQPFGKIGTPTIRESPNGSSGKVGTVAVLERQNETHSSEPNKRETPPSKRRKDPFAMPTFSPLTSPLFVSTAKSMIAGAELAISEIKSGAKKIQAMGKIQDGPRKGEAAPIPGKYHYEPPEAQAAIDAWKDRIKEIKIAMAR